MIAGYRKTQDGMPSEGGTGMSLRKMLVFTIFAVLTLILACGSAFSAEAVPNKIKVGLMFGLTGAASPVGPVQLQGAKLAVKEINEKGGVNLGGKKIPLEAIVKDDETKPDVAIRRYRELLTEDKVQGVVGSTFAPIAAALNKEVQKSPAVYFAACVAPIAMFKKSDLAPSTFGILGDAYSIGYAGAAYIINELHLKNIYFFAPAYAFGWDQYAGAKDAAAKYGAKIEYSEAPVGTSDFSSYIIKIAEKKPDIVMMAQWGVDAISVLKQSNELGLNKKTKIWFDWMTQVFGGGVPVEALEGVYSLMFWNWNMDGFADATVVKATKDFVARYQKEYGAAEVPDPYAAVAYISVKELVRGIELAQSVDTKAVTAALMKSPKFDSEKGPGVYREDHHALFKYGAFVVVGKSAKEKKSKGDLVKLIGAYTGEDYLPTLNSLGY
jgi:branched-chain amino acid transport system substrate-binding protein